MYTATATTIYAIIAQVLAVRFPYSRPTIFSGNNTENSTMKLEYAQATGGHKKFPTCGQYGRVKRQLVQLICRKGRQ